MSDQYLRHVRAAREAGIALTASQQRTLAKELQQYADELSSIVRSKSATRSQIVVYREVTRLLDQMETGLLSFVTRGTTLQARTMAEMQARAHFAALGAQGLSGEAFANRMTGGSSRLAQSVIARDGVADSFATLRRGAGRKAQRILQTVAARGGDLRAAERPLRLIVRGSEDIPEEFLFDRRLIGRKAVEEYMGIPNPTRAEVDAVKSAAHGVSGKARLIARTEMANAEREVEAVAMHESPIVEYGEWFTSNRHKGFDSCDVLEQSDFYDLGPGRYPATAIPVRPHPRCLCGVRHGLRPVKDWDKPKDDGPPIILNPLDVGRKAGLTPSQVRSVQQALTVGEARRDSVLSNLIAGARAVASHPLTDLARDAHSTIGTARTARRLLRALGSVSLDPNGEIAVHLSKKVKAGLLIRGFAAGAAEYQAYFAALAASGVSATSAAAAQGVQGLRLLWDRRIVTGAADRVESRIGEIPLYRSGRIRPAAPPPVPRGPHPSPGDLDDMDDWLRNLPDEHVAIHDASDRLVVIVKGNRNSATLPNFDVAGLRLTHNHPPWATDYTDPDTWFSIGFSEPDIRTFSTRGLAEIRAVTPFHTFSLRRPRPSFFPPKSRHTWYDWNSSTGQITHGRTIPPSVHAKTPGARYEALTRRFRREMRDEPVFATSTGRGTAPGRNTTFRLWEGDAERPRYWVYDDADDLRAGLARGERALTEAQFESEVRHQAMKIVADEMGWSYRRLDVPDPARFTIPHSGTTAAGTAAADDLYYHFVNRHSMSQFTGISYGNAPQFRLDLQPTRAFEHGVAADSWRSLFAGADAVGSVARDARGGAGRIMDGLRGRVSQVLPAASGRTLVEQSRDLRELAADWVSVDWKWAEVAVRIPDAVAGAVPDKATRFYHAVTNPDRWVGALDQARRTAGSVTPDPRDVIRMPAAALSSARLVAAEAAATVRDGATSALARRFPTFPAPAPGENFFTEHLRAIDEWLTPQTREAAFAMTPHGRVVLYRQGAATVVPITRLDRELIAGNWLIHNHAAEFGDRAFGAADLLELGASRAKGGVLLTRSFRYELQRADGLDFRPGRLTLERYDEVLADEIARVFRQRTVMASAAARDNLPDAVRGSAILAGEAEEIALHATMQRLAAELGWAYRRIERARPVASRPRLPLGVFTSQFVERKVGRDAGRAALLRERADNLLREAAVEDVLENAAEAAALRARSAEILRLLDEGIDPQAGHLSVPRWVRRKNLDVEAEAIAAREIADRLNEHFGRLAHEFDGVYEFDPDLDDEAAVLKWIRDKVIELRDVTFPRMRALGFPTTVKYLRRGATPARSWEQPYIPIDRARRLGESLAAEMRDEARAKWARILGGEADMYDQNVADWADRFDGVKVYGMDANSVPNSARAIGRVIALYRTGEAFVQRSEGLIGFWSEVVESAARRKYGAAQLAGLIENARGDLAGRMYHRVLTENLSVTNFETYIRDAARILRRGGDADTLFAPDPVFGQVVLRRLRAGEDPDTLARYARVYQQFRQHQYAGANSAGSTITTNVKARDRINRMILDRELDGIPVRPPTVRTPATIRREVGLPEQQIRYALGERVGPPTGANTAGESGFWRGARGDVYVKQYADAGQAQAEAIANLIYQDLRLGAPRSYLGRLDPDGPLLHVADIVDNVGTIADVGLTKETADRILDGFIADVLTVNRDAIGPLLDNIVIDAVGNVHRIDNGNSFQFRFLRRKQPEGLRTIEEFETLFTRNTNYRKVFDAAGIDSVEALGDRLIDQIDSVVALRDAHGGWEGYLELVKDVVDADVLDEIRGILDARTTLLLEKRTELLRGRGKLDISAYPTVEDALADAVRGAGDDYARLFARVLVEGDLRLEMEVMADHIRSALGGASSGSDKTAAVQLAVNRALELKNAAIGHLAHNGKAPDPDSVNYRAKFGTALDSKQRGVDRAAVLASEHAMRRTVITRVLDSIERAEIKPSRDWSGTVTDWLVENREYVEELADEILSGNLDAARGLNFNLHAIPDISALGRDDVIAAVHRGLFSRATERGQALSVATVQGGGELFEETVRQIDPAGLAAVRRFVRAEADKLAETARAARRDLRSFLDRHDGPLPADLQADYDRALRLRKVAADVRESLRRLELRAEALRSQMPTALGRALSTPAAHERLVLSQVVLETVERRDDAQFSMAELFRTTTGTDMLDAYTTIVNAREAPVFVTIGGKVYDVSVDLAWPGDSLRFVANVRGPFLPSRPMLNELVVDGILREEYFRFKQHVVGAALDYRLGLATKLAEAERLHEIMREAVVDVAGDPQVARTGIFEFVNERIRELRAAGSLTLDEFDAGYRERIEELYDAHLLRNWYQREGSLLESKEKWLELKAAQIEGIKDALGGDVGITDEVRAITDTLRSRRLLQRDLDSQAKKLIAAIANDPRRRSFAGTLARLEPSLAPDVFDSDAFEVALYKFRDLRERLVAGAAKIANETQDAVLEEWVRATYEATQRQLRFVGGAPARTRDIAKEHVAEYARRAGYARIRFRDGTEEVLDSYAAGRVGARTLNETDTDDFREAVGVGSMNEWREVTRPTDQVVVWRGHSPRIPRAEGTQDYLGRLATQRLQPFSSVSTSPFKAIEFAQARMDPATKRQALTAHFIDKRDIFSTALSGPGTFYEAELNILGGHVTSITWDLGDKIELQEFHDILYRMRAAGLLGPDEEDAWREATRLTLPPGAINSGNLDPKGEWADLLGWELRAIAASAEDAAKTFKVSRAEFEDFIEILENDQAGETLLQNLMDAWVADPDEFAGLPDPVALVQSLHGKAKNVTEALDEIADDLYGVSRLADVDPDDLDWDDVVSDLFSGAYTDAYEHIYYEEFVGALATHGHKIDAVYDFMQSDYEHWYREQYLQSYVGEYLRQAAQGYFAGDAGGPGDTFDFGTIEAMLNPPTPPDLVP